MTSELAARLRSATLAQVQAYRRARVRQGDTTIIARWHMAQLQLEQFPDWPEAQREWARMQERRAAYEAGLAEIDAIIREKAG